MASEFAATVLESMMYTMTSLLCGAPCAIDETTIRYGVHMSNRNQRRAFRKIVQLAVDVGRADPILHILPAGCAQCLRDRALALSVLGHRRCTLPGRHERLR